MNLLNEGKSIQLLVFLTEDRWTVVMQCLLQHEEASASGTQGDRWSYF